MKKFLIVLAMSLCLIVGVSYLVGSVIDPMNNQAVYTATTTSENKVIQQRLKKWGYYTGAIDGILGPKSITAIKKFQKNNGLVVDGIVGPKTAEKIGITLSTSSTSSNFIMPLPTPCWFVATMMYLNFSFKIFKASITFGKNSNSSIFVT